MSSTTVTGIRVQVARNLLDPVDGFLRNASHLIHDRDPLFTSAWTALLKSSGVKCVPIPAQSPNCNPHAERFVKTIRTECLDEFVIFGERHLRYLVGTFVDHYLTGRYHQGIGGQLIRPPVLAGNDNRTAGAIRMSVAARRTAEFLPSRGGVTCCHGYADTTGSREARLVFEAGAVALNQAHGE